MSQPGPRPLKRLVPPALSLALLTGMGLANLNLPSQGDAEPYHARILALSAAQPLEFGTWVGRAYQLPVSAVQLLKPNAILSRSYTDPVHRRRAEFMIVQCKDARDLSGHWPPNCYKASGYTLTHRENTTWDVDGLTIPGVEYHFELNTASMHDRIVVSNFMILPGGGFVGGMDGVREAGADYRRRHFGAAQVQVLTDEGYPDAAREAMVVEMIRQHLPLIEAIRQIEPAPADTPPPSQESPTSATNNQGLRHKKAQDPPGEPNRTLDPPV